MWLWWCLRILHSLTPLCVRVLLQVVFNPKDSNTFASASLDRTVKVRWPPATQQQACHMQLYAACTPRCCTLTRTEDSAG
jgi:hypothetical protein